MIPHPMYSVGYAWMYGAALLSNSFVVFGLALFSHMMQMLFLMFVETPHIEKIYGAPPNLADKSRSNIMLFRHFDIFRASDLSLALVAALTVGVFALAVEWDPLHKTCGGTGRGAPCLTETSWISDDQLHDPRKSVCTLHAWHEWYCATRVETDAERGETHLAEWGHCSCGSFGMYAVVGHFVLWRLLKTCISGYVLHRQDKSKWWTLRFCKGADGEEERNRRRLRAFESWKQLSNLLSTMSGIAFTIAAWYLYEPLDASTAGNTYAWTAAEVFCVLAGIMLLWLNHWSNCEVESAIGEYGWFFGDFFFDTMPEEIAGVPGGELTFSGIYRYVNNPDALFGFAGFYGIALLCHSWTLAFLAAFSQLMNFVFIYAIEIPHSKRVHKARYRKRNPTMRRVHEKAKQIRDRAESAAESIERRVREKAKQIRDRADSAAEDIVSTIVGGTRQRRSHRQRSPTPTPRRRSRRRRSKSRG